MRRRRTLLFDFATLTGAARVALGPDLPPFYTDDDALAGRNRAPCAPRSAIRCGGCRYGGPTTRWSPARSPISPMSPASPFAGSITAALFLQRFVGNAKAWAHFDIYAWNPAARARRPEGGEVQAARALFALLGERFGDASPGVS